MFYIQRQVCETDLGKFRPSKPKLRRHSNLALVEPTAENDAVDLGGPPPFGPEVSLERTGERLHFHA